MPTYSYKCDSCGLRREEQHSLRAIPNIAMCSCGGSCRRGISLISGLLGGRKVHHRANNRPGESSVTAIHIEGATNTQIVDCEASSVGRFVSTSGAKGVTIDGLVARNVGEVIYPESSSDIVVRRVTHTASE